MWAVGRLSLLSKTRALAAYGPTPELSPKTAVAVPATVAGKALSNPVTTPVPPAAEAPGVLQGIVNRVTRFFRDLFV